jgi:hypothetical protein
VEEVTYEPLYRDRVCGIDIGKAQMAATIRVPSDRDPARRAAETRTFGTTKREVLALADWLRCWQVPTVVMEATGVIRGRDQASATDSDSAVLSGSRPVADGLSEARPRRVSRPLSRDGASAPFPA